MTSMHFISKLNKKNLFSILKPIFLLVVSVVLQACSLFGSSSDATKEADTTTSSQKSSQESSSVGSLFKRQVKETKNLKDESAPKKRLMILPFLDASESRSQELRNHARSEFIKELNRQGELIVIDTSELKVDLSKNIKNGDYVLTDVAKSASDLGVNAILEGKIIDLKVNRKADPVGIFRQIKTRFEANVRVRIATARSGKEIFNTTRTVTLEESQNRVSENVTIDRMMLTHPELLEKLVADAFIDFSPQISASLNKLTWEGRIAMINGERIFLNVGKVTGLMPGDLLKVTEEGTEVFDPQTGSFIGKTQGRMKGTLEVMSFFGQDGAIAIIHSGAGFKEGDRVEQY